MEFIASYWLLWLVGGLACGGYVVRNQLQRMKGMASNFSRSFATSSSRSFETALDNTAKSFFSGMTPMIVVSLVGSGFWLLFLISLVVNIAHSFAH